MDVAVLLDGRLIKAERFKLRLKLMRKLSSRLRADRVDVIVMNDAPVTLKYEIIKHGKTLVVKEDEIKLEAESKILSTYLDRIYYERRSLNEFLERVIERGEL